MITIDNVAPTWLKHNFKLKVSDCAQSKTWDFFWTVICKTWPRLFRSKIGLLGSAIFNLLHRMLSSFVATSLNTVKQLWAFLGPWVWRSQCMAIHGPGHICGAGSAELSKYFMHKIPQPNSSLQPSGRVGSNPRSPTFQAGSFNHCTRGPLLVNHQTILPVNTKHLHNICTTSAQRLRRWSNIVQMLYKCFVFTGYTVMSAILFDDTKADITSTVHAGIRPSAFWALSG